MTEETPESRHEAEARSILALPHLSQRRAWLEYVEKTHGKTKADALKNTMGEIWDREHGKTGS